MTTDIRELLELLLVLYGAERVLNALLDLLKEKRPDFDAADIVLERFGLED